MPGVLTRFSVHRHWFARLTPDAWEAGLLRAEGCFVPDGGIIGAWIEAGRPLVVRRPCWTPEGQLCCGLSLPPQAGKLRWPFQVQARGVREMVPPPRLGDCLTVAPEEWKPGLAQCVQGLEDQGLAPRVFGSLAWKYLTALDYLHSESDVDMLVAISRKSDVAALESVLASLGDGGPPIEVEILLPDFRSFQIAEFSLNTRDVLVKSDGSVQLASKESLLDGLCD